MTVMLPRPQSVTDETVTVSRADWERLIEQLEDQADLAAVEISRAREVALGPEEFGRLCYTGAEAERVLLGDVSPLTIWRERAGMTQRGLARAAGVSSSSLAEIESGKKPGSAAVLRAVAQAFGVPMEHLLS